MKEEEKDRNHDFTKDQGWNFKRCWKCGIAFDTRTGKEIWQHLKKSVTHQNES